MTNFSLVFQVKNFNYFEFLELLSIDLEKPMECLDMLDQEEFLCEYVEATLGRGSM